MNLSPGSLAWRLALRQLPPILLLVLLDLAATWIITNQIGTERWVLRDIFWLMVLGQLMLALLFVVVVVQGVRSGLRSVQDLADAISQRSIDDMQPMEVAGLPTEIAPLVTHINDLLGRLDDSMAAQMRFIGHAAHQLRTPLAGLRMESELMLANPLPHDVRARAERIKAVSDRMIRLGQQLLALARADHNTRPRERFTRIDLCEWVLASGAEWIPRARAQQVEIDLTAPGQPVWVDGDPLLLDELLGNLIDNALRYGQSQGGRIALTVRDQPPTLVVEDDGPGIAPQEQERVFEAFYRSQSAPPGGSGLGLAIVREIASAHGASWHITSLPEYAGTRLTVVFPPARASAAANRRQP